MIREQFQGSTQQGARFSGHFGHGKSTPLIALPIAEGRGSALKAVRGEGDFVKSRYDLDQEQARCEVYVLTKEEGGRHTPFFNCYRPQFYFRTTDVTGSKELITPMAMETELRFSIREGGRTVGAGVVTEILE